MLNILGLSILKFYSYFHKEIKVIKKKNLSGEIKYLVTNVDNGGNVGGKVFRPTPSTHKVMAIVIGMFMFIFLGLVFQSMSLDYIFNTGPWWFIPVFLIVLFFLFYYSFFTYWIGTWYLRKNLDKYFIYVGEEGIIRKDSNKITFIPWDIVTGVNFFSSVRAGGSYLELEIKGHLVWTPKLVKGASDANVFADWVEYSAQDMRGIESIIKRFI